jgi:hypothetical protein
MQRKKRQNKFYIKKTARRKRWKNLEHVMVIKIFQYASEQFYEGSCRSFNISCRICVHWKLMPVSFPRESEL